MKPDKLRISPDAARSSPIPSIDVVVPIFNEEECVDELLARLLAMRVALLGTLSVRFIFVDDGSKDRSYEMLEQAAAEGDAISLIRFSRNFGHQIAVTAGLDHADADWVAIIDGDLQDPPELIPQMVARAKEVGANVVYGQRRRRDGESILKLASASVFYRLLRWMCDLDIPHDTGDFRLIDRKVLQAMQVMREHHRFLRGLVPWVGFKSEAFLYDRDVRYAGATKYSLRKMFRLAIDASMSFSRMPLRLATSSGVFVLALGSAFAIYIAFLRLFTNHVVPGLAAILALMAVLGGMQIIILGLIGEYVGKLFEESKGRPLYVVSERRNLSASDAAASSVKEVRLANAVVA